MTTDDEADAAAAALAHSGLDELKRIAYSRPTSSDEAARSLEAQRLLAAHEEREARARARDRAEALAREASRAAEPAHPLSDAGAPIEAPSGDASASQDPEPPPARRRAAVVAAALVAAAAAAALAIVLIGNLGIDVVGAVAGDPEPTPTPSVSATLPPPNPDYMNEVRDLLGPVPKDGTMSAKEVDAVVASMVDWAWESVSREYPDAVRPEVEVIRMTEAHEHSAVQVDCLVARGIDASVSTGDSYTYNATSGAEMMISVYQCAAEYPMRPPPELTAKQVGYFYDYLVQFAVPCLERLGYEQTPPPLREDFVSDWPSQTWFAEAGPVTASKTSRAVAAACPPMPEGLF